VRASAREALPHPPYNVTLLAGNENDPKLIEAIDLPSST